jgi:hypothetical protein
MKVSYTLKRSRVGGPKEYPDLDAMMKALREILEDREKSGFVGKVWLTIEGRKHAAPTL